MPEPAEPLRPVPLGPAPERKPPRRWPLLVVLVLIVGAAVAVWNARRQTGGAGPGVPVARTAKVFAGPFQQTLRVSGTVGAKNFAAIVAPQMRGREGGGSSSGGSSSGGGGDRGRGMSSGGGGGPSQLILMKLAAPGTHVKKGDVIAQFDSQWELEHIDSHKATVNQTQAVVDKRKAEIAIESQTIQQQLRQALAESEKAKLDLKTAEVKSAIDAEKLKLAVEETAARYKQFQEDVKLKKLSQEAELRSLEMQVQQEQHHVDRHNRNIERMTIRAPIDGLVVMQSIFRSGQFGQVQEGDQVYPGTFFMQIVDLSQMIVNGSVNQVNSHSLSLGQKATVRLEAYPDLALPGRVLAVGAMASGGARGYRGSSRDLWVKQIPVRFAIDARDSRVIPDLSASADVVLFREEKVPQVPRDAVVEENGKAYVKVRQGETWQRREIQAGRKNGSHLVVLAGLTEGDEVLLEP
jgi:multidrug resistance efflux pump